MNDFLKLRNVKLTENGDTAFNSTNNKLLDILFFAPYLSKNLDEVSIGKSYKEILFSRFMRDPRHGLGYRDLGRVLMAQSGANPEEVVKSGRFDDLIEMAFLTSDMSFLDEIINEAKKGNQLAKKWLPRLNAGTKDSDGQKIARAICKHYGMTQKEYRKLIKAETVERKISYAELTVESVSVFNELFKTTTTVSHPLIYTIDYSKVPSLAMIKHYNTFLKFDSVRFKEYLESVKKGDAKLNVATTTPYNVYKNRHVIDADLFFDKLEKIEINCVPIVDTSYSMQDGEDSFGKALAIGHYLAQCSTFEKGTVIPFSSKPHLIQLNQNSSYNNQISSMETYDCSNTDFGAVMKLLAGLKKFPEYLVVLSDMEFDRGSSQSKDSTMNIFKKHGAETKLVWWNFNARNKTAPETDEYGNIFMSGYSPQMLKFLEHGFDGEAMLDAMLKAYEEVIN